MLPTNMYSHIAFLYIVTYFVVSYYRFLNTDPENKTTFICTYPGTKLPTQVQKL
jgi:hypothetical protein